MTKLTLDSVLTFGKHVDKTIDWVCKNDPSYIFWIDENSRDHIVSNVAYDAAKRQIKEKRFTYVGPDIGDLHF